LDLDGTKTEGNRNDMLHRKAWYLG
jgi:hypothetical protein